VFTAIGQEVLTSSSKCQDSERPVLLAKETSADVKC